MKRPLRRALRGCISLTLALATLWVVAAATPAESLGEAARALSDNTQPLALLRFERGELFPSTPLSLPASLALKLSPLLLSSHDEVTAAWNGVAETADPEVRETDPQAPLSQPTDNSKPTPDDIVVRDNGVPSTTLRPSDPAGYLTRGSVYVHNSSSASLTESDLSGSFSASLTDNAPQVLIVHTHGCEAYTMPEGEEYEESDDHRTLDETKNVLRVGDEIAQVLTNAGIGVLHDRTLHDYPSYSGAYNRSLETIEHYRSEYPSIVYIFDIHRDAVADAQGNQYKLLCAEEPTAAQLEFVIGSDGGGLEHPKWRDNLRLACAVQETLLADHPTLMRPIIVRNSRYNQQVTTGSLLVEVGTAGNSLEEALVAARLFADGFVKTIKTGWNQSPD